MYMRGGGLVLLSFCVLGSGCFLKQSFQVDPCLVPHTTSPGATKTLGRRLNGTAWVEPIIEDALKREYGTCEPNNNVRKEGVTAEKAPAGKGPAEEGPGPATTERSSPEATAHSAWRGVFGWFGFGTTEPRCTLAGLPKERRNDLIEQVLTRCDLICANHKSGFVAQNVLQNLGFGVAGVGLSAAASVASGGMSQVLSAAATGTQGAGTEVSKDVYNEKVGAAIANAIDADQTAKKTQIRTREREGIDTYPVYAGLDDVQKYHESCSFSSGLDLVQKEVGTAKEKANADYKSQLIDKFNPDAATDLLRAFWMPDGKHADPTNEKKIRAWMDSNKLKGVSITMLLNGATYADARTKAVNGLGLK